MDIKLGPILYANSDGSDEEEPSTWNFRINLLLTGAEDEPPLEIGSASHNVQIDGPEIAYAFPEYGSEGAYYWAWDVQAERRGEGRWISYEINSTDENRLALPDWLADPVEGIYIPKEGAIPDFAFFSCNGVSKESLYHQMKKPHRLWSDILEQQREAREGEGTGFSLLIGGGDQIYADQLWQEPPLKEFEGVDEEQKLGKPTGPDFVPRLKESFVDLYSDHWTREGMRQVFARIPGLFTWDDHDIVDGWGSYPEKKQKAPCYQGLYEAASDCFEAFQLGGEKNHCYNEDEHYLQSLTFKEANHELDLLVLDIRSGRTRNQVMQETQWDDLKNILEEHVGRDAETDEDRTRHLIVVSSIPLVFLQYRIGHLPINVGGLQDDLIDQWQHSRHRGERSRMIMRLLRHSKRSGARVTILSGDVHVGSRGRVVSDNPRHVPDGHPKSQAIIHQVTSSGIGHPPPSYWKWKGILVASDDEPDDIGDQVIAEVLPITSDEEHLRKRNWLIGRFDDPDDEGLEGAGEDVQDVKRQRLWMKWRVEEQDVEEGGQTVRSINEEVVASAFSDAPNG